MKKLAVLLAMAMLLMSGTVLAKDVNGLMGVGGEAGFMGSGMSYGAMSLTKYVSPTMGLQFLLGTHYYSSGEEMPDPDNAGKMTDPDPLMDVSLGARGLFGLMGGKRSTLAFVAGLGFSMHRKEAVDSKFLTDVNLELGLRAEHFFSPEFAVNCLTGLSITYGLENEDAGRTKSFMAADLAGAMFGGAGFTFYFP